MYYVNIIPYIIPPCQEKYRIVTEFVRTFLIQKKRGKALPRIINSFSLCLHKPLALF